MLKKFWLISTGTGHSCDDELSSSEEFWLELRFGKSEKSIGFSRWCWAKESWSLSWCSSNKWSKAQFQKLNRWFILFKILTAQHSPRKRFRHEIINSFQFSFDKNQTILYVRTLFYRIIIQIRHKMYFGHQNLTFIL